ncbi:hypothetical protein [Nonomuraea sp. NEAU-A123]|uniref:hypothetical protein n=1 Tax=Nonomuraea sp. NEAU-A123 TaxID=2839649 RepID=UPI001BE445BF|nr:hypothetical protein [Nonomuraea sp. NEAU-A123]MBT2232531.1 hypothetical protein [Nonomuraea sp. NEAU-A123]
MEIGMVSRITGAARDWLRATLQAVQAPMGDDMGSLFLPSATYTWWAVGLHLAPAPSLCDAYRLTYSGAYTTIHEPGYRASVAVLTLPAGWRADHGGEYR